MKKNIYLILIFCACQLFGQNQLPTPDELKEHYESIENPNSKESIKKIQELIASSEKIHFTEGVAIGKMMMLKVYFFHSNYKEVLRLTKEVEALQTKNYHRSSMLNIYKSYANKALGLSSLELKNIQDALQYAKRIEDDDKRHYVKSVVHNRFSVYYDYQSPDSLLYHLKKELEELEKVSDEKYIKEKKGAIALNNINIGNFYLGVHQPQRLDLAEPYYMRAYELRKRYPDIFEIYELRILNGVGRFYLEKGKYEKSIAIAKKVLAIEKNKKNPFHRLFAYQLLADSNTELGNSVEQAKYTLLYSKLNDSLNDAAKKEVDEEFDRQMSKVEETHSADLKAILLIGGGIVLLGVLAIAMLQKRKKAVEKQHRAEKKLFDERKERLDKKNRELTSVSMEMTDAQNRLSNILNQSSNQELSENMKLQIKNILGKKGYWDFFNKKFVEVHPRFREGLKKEFPSFTEKDIDFCVLLKLKMHNKEIAQLMGISHQSVITKKYRLNKKLDTPEKKAIFKRIIA